MLLRTGEAQLAALVDVAGVPLDLLRALVDVGPHLPACVLEAAKVVELCVLAFGVGPAVDLVIRNALQAGESSGGVELARLRFDFPPALVGGLRGNHLRLAKAAERVKVTVGALAPLDQPLVDFISMLRDAPVAPAAAHFVQFTQHSSSLISTESAAVVACCCVACANGGERVGVLGVDSGGADIPFGVGGGVVT